MAAQTPARLAPLLAQFDTSVAALAERLDGVDDHEWRIAWLAGHLAEMGLLRADYTDGDHDLTPSGLCTQWPGTADAGVAFMLGGLDRWRTTLSRMSDKDLDTVGRSQMPWGLDPNLPLLDIVWWVNREVVHHAAEIAYIRDLYAQLGRPTPEEAA